MSKVTAKFQITIPPEVRRVLNITPGMNMAFKEEKGRYFIVKHNKKDPIDKWRGILKAKIKTDQAIADLRGYEFENID